MWRENEEGRFIHYGAAFFIRIINSYNYINILHIIVMVFPLKLLDAFGCSWLSGDMFKRKIAKSGNENRGFIGASKTPCSNIFIGGHILCYAE